MRDLNSMFLDEGFGTLDEDTLETVATTLERLAADSDRMANASEAWNVSPPDRVCTGRRAPASW
jgi:hypothetical protein